MQQSKFLKFHLESKGLLMAYKTSKAEREEAEVVNWAKDLGINVKQFSKEEILKINLNHQWMLQVHFGMKGCT